jgi:hypothetical protein
MDTFKAIDKLTITEIRALYAEAQRTGKQVDWETATLIPRKYEHLTHHQRDFVAREETRRQEYRDKRDAMDNDPASPQEAGY